MSLQSMHLYQMHRGQLDDDQPWPLSSRFGLVALPTGAEMLSELFSTGCDHSYEHEYQPARSTYLHSPAFQAPSCFAPYNSTAYQSTVFTSSFEASHFDGFNHNPQPQRYYRQGSLPSDGGSSSCSDKINPFLAEKFQQPSPYEPMMQTPYPATQPFGHFDSTAYSPAHLGIALSVIQSSPDQSTKQHQDHVSEPEDTAMLTPVSQFEYSQPAEMLDPQLRSAQQPASPVVAQSSRSETPASSDQDGEYEEDSGSDWVPNSKSPRSKRRGSQLSTSSRTARRTDQKRLVSSQPSSSTPSESSHKIAKTRGKKKARTQLKEGRLFPCPFAHYGCPANFDSKNEWKRHISTQHIKLWFWRCGECPVEDEAEPCYNDFNRKDLFAMHLRRMHIPGGLDEEKRRIVNKKGGPATLNAIDERIKKTAVLCMRPLRESPAYSSCILCERCFSGPGTWEDCIDHIAGHFEKNKSKQGKTEICKWRRDERFEAWLEDEGLIERVNEAGAWKIGKGQPLRRIP